MKVLLISANTETINMQAVPWGLACVAQAIKEAGHDTYFLDLLMESDLLAAIHDTISKFSPDLIGISVRNIDDQNRSHPVFFLEKIKQIIVECKRLSEVPIVLGGAGYSIFPERALDYLGADMGIQGEGEKAFLELLNQLENAGDLSEVPGLFIKGLGCRKPRLFFDDLDSLPFPDVGILEKYRHADADLWIPVQTRRGCFMKCSYCSTIVIEGQELRQRSPELVTECLSKYVQAGFNRIYFVDNNFSIPRSHGYEICRAIIEKDIEITWRCILNPLHVDDELVSAMAAAGCKEVSIGFESGNKQILKNMNKRFSLNDIRNTARLLAKYGIRRMGFLLLGGPGESKESVKESLTFAESLGLESMRVTAGIRIYPDTKLAQSALEDGFIAEDDNLLYPHFYLAKDLEGWIEDTLAKWKTSHPNWFI